MRFMMLMKSDAKTEAGALPDEKILVEMGKLDEEMRKTGVMLAGEGLKASADGVRVRLSGKGAARTFTVIDGPFAEANELIAGFWLLQTKSKEEALAWAKRVPGGEGENRDPAGVRAVGLPGRPRRAAAGVARSGAALPGGRRGPAARTRAGAAGSSAQAGNDAVHGHAQVRPEDGVGRLAR